MIKSADFGEPIQSIDGLQEAANSFTLRNLKDQIEQIKSLNVSDTLKDALKGYYVDGSDLSGATRMQALSATQAIYDESLRKQVQDRFRKGEFSAEAIYKVFLKGLIDDSDVIEKIENEERKLEREDFKATVKAQIQFDSNMSSLTNLSESIRNGEAVTDDILNLIDSMPEFANYLSDIGMTISDFDLDGMADNIDAVQTAISKTKFKELTDFLNLNKNASSAQRMWNIMKTGLNGLTAADYQLKNSALYDLVKGGGYSSEAVIKTGLMLDNDLIPDEIDSIQSMLGSLDAQVKANVSLEGLNDSLAGMGALTTAIADFNETGNVSAETIAMMEKAGLSYNDFLYETESGVKVNTVAARNYMDTLKKTGIAMTDIWKQNTLDKMKQNRAAMEEMIEGYKDAQGNALTLETVLGDVAKYGGQFAEVFSLDAANQSLYNTANALSNVQS
jgi:hypothetical protein